MNNFLAILLMVSAGGALMYYLKNADSKSTVNPVSSPMAAARGAVKAGSGNVKAQHVAAVTAAILAATQGRGRILSIVPQAGPVSISSSSTRRWCEAGIVASVGRHIAPSWKR